MKNYIKSCAYNIDSGCVEVNFSNGAMMSIDCITVENEIANNICQRSDLDYLIYNKPAEYVELILNSEIEKFLKI